MGNVVTLAEHRLDRWEARALGAAQHPSLRWVAGDMYYLAHRRDTATGGAHCGAGGSLVLAPPGVPTCEHCYPTITVEETG